jgi:hypothetical protein
MSYNNNNIHYYSIVDFPEEQQLYGKFKGTTPKAAANKAFSSLIKFIDIDKSNEDNFLGKFIVFVIKNIETNEEYKYIGNRIKLENTVTIVKDGKEIKYNYKNVIGKYNKELDKL